MDNIVAIAGIGSNYNNVYEGTYAARKNDAVKKAETKEAAPAQTGKAKDASEKVASDYYSYLQKNYDQGQRDNIQCISEEMFRRFRKGEGIGRFSEKDTGTGRARV